MPEVLATGGEDDLVGPDAPPLTGQGHIHQLLLTLHRIQGHKIQDTGSHPPAPPHSAQGTGA